MKKAYALSIVMLTILVACNFSNETNNWEPSEYDNIHNFDGVSMLVKEKSLSPTGLIVIMINDSDKGIAYGGDFKLEKKIDRDWYQVPVIIKGEHAFTSIGYELVPTESREIAIDWEKLHGSQDSGEYRIVKSISEQNDAGGYRDYYTIVNFTIE